MKKLPISIQTFEKIIDNNMIYVDKTNYVWDLVNQGTYYFLSRPRRFGKSLLLSTLKAYFEGKKELFKGLYIEEKEKDWAVYPIIYMDGSAMSYKNGIAEFRTSLLNLLRDIAGSYDIDLKHEIPSDAFIALVKSLQRKYNQKVVILIDEYDKPLIDSLLIPERFEENKVMLNTFYGVMKGLDPYLRFVMLTGVSRFSKVSVFSGLNNLDDISMNRRFSNIVGFSEAELMQYFQACLEELANTFSTTVDALMPDIRSWYNGFSFDGENRLYNPFSVLSLFSNCEFKNYWFSTGTPTFLINHIKKKQYIPENFEKLKVVDLIGSTIQVERLPLVPLLFQTGYLTIESWGRDGLRPYYYLNYPNEEVRFSFVSYIAASFMDKEVSDFRSEGLLLKDALLNENLSAFAQQLTSIFADIPARLHLPKEAYYHSLVYLLLRFIGMQMLLEKETDKGRIDGVLELEDKIYIMEFKFAKNKRIKQVKTLSAQALKQIKEKKYHEAYLSQGKKIILFGIGFLDKKIDGKWTVLE